MVYDYTDPAIRIEHTGLPGYAIHDSGAAATEINEPRFSLFADDGHGNGDYICGTEDVYWIRRIAHALDMTDVEFDALGNPR